MKSLIKKTFIYKFYLRWRFRRMVRERFDAELAYFSAYNMDSTPSREGEAARLVAMYHVLEKGLTMPARRLGFGQPMALSIVQKLEQFRTKYGDTTDAAYQHAVAVLREYAELHRQEGFALNAELQAALERVLAENPFEASSQIRMTPETYWSAGEKEFAAFSASRHSVRNYGEGTVPEEKIRAAVELANNAPSACNRQPCRVYCVREDAAKERLLQIQGGNRGFGHLADKVLVLTCDRRSFMLTEPFSVYVNGGIYLMNLAYALHYEQIAHCILTWVASPVLDEEAHRLLDIPAHEAIIACMTLGNLPNGEFPLASSPRKSAGETLVMR